MKKNIFLFEKEKLMNYFKASKFSFLVILLFILLVYGQRIISNSFSMDTEHYIYSYSSNFEWWLILNRWGLVLINKIFGFTPLVFWVTNFLTVLMIFVYSISFNYLFYSLIDDRYKKVFTKVQFIFPIIFVTSPIFVEQYNFLNQNFAVSLAIFLCSISLFLIIRAEMFDSKKIKFLVYFISILLSTLSFGVYQSLITLYILGFVSCYFLKLFFSKDNYSFKFLIKNMIIFGISCLLYFAICKIFGYTNSYLKFEWFSNPVLHVLRNICYASISVIKCETIFYNVSYLIALIFIFVFFIYNLLAKKINFEKILCFLGLVLSPFYLFIITGANQLKRTQFNYSFFIGFVFLFFLMFLYDRFKNKVLAYLLIFVSIGVAYRQSYISANLFHSDNLRFNSDVTLANKIQYDIEKVDNYNSNFKYTIIFLGHKYDKPMNSWLSGEVIGSSFFEFDYKEIYGVNQRANIFMKTLGYDYEFASREQFDWAKKYSDEMKPFPNKGYISIKGNNIIVKLSDDI